jgi:hypothetical protein
MRRYIKMAFLALGTCTTLKLSFKHIDMMRT